jgi:prephenate dehydrogenase
MSFQFERVALIGIGLIGSSLSHAIRRKGYRARDYWLRAK